MKQNQLPVGNTTKGFFVAFADETKELKKLNLVNTGRSGVFYKKEDLLTTLESRDVLLAKRREINIVEIDVPTCAIISPNCVKFGIKGGKDIRIIKFQSFVNAQKEIEKMAVA